MSSVNQPYVTATLVPDQSTVSLAKPRVLIVGSVPVAANAIFGADTVKFLQRSPTTSYELASDTEVRNLVGNGTTYERFLKATSGSAQAVPIDFLLVKDATATATTSTITLTAPPAKDGRIVVDLLDGFKYTATVDFLAAATVASIATAIAAQLNSETIRPFNAVAALGVVTITWNDTWVTASTPIHVVTADTALAPVVANVGAVAPSQPSSTVLDVIGDTRYTHILWPDYYFASIGFVNTLLESRFNAFNDVVSGVAWTTMTDSFVNLTTNTSTFNTKSLIFVGAKKVNGLFGASFGADKKNLPDSDLAFIAAAHARMLTADADLSDLGFIAEGLNDYRGGNHMASFPIHNIVIPDTKPSNPLWYFTHVEQKLLNDANVSTYGVNRTGTTTISGNMLTMWKTDSQGNVNTTWTQVEFLYTAMVVREWMDSAARVKFGNMRMTNGDLIVGYSMVNQASVEEWALSEKRNLANIALVTAGADSDKSFMKSLTVTLIPSTTTINISATYEIVSHVGIINYTIQTTTKYRV